MTEGVWAIDEAVGPARKGMVEPVMMERLIVQPDGRIISVMEPIKAVLCHGCFDNLHLGHIRHLQEARKLGDRLIVSVSSDRFVNKGIGRPHFSAEHRAEALRALSCVDEVIINDNEGAWDLIHKIKPAFYVKGVDYVGVNSDGLEKERIAIKAVGGQIKFTGTRKWSSSALIKADKFPPETLEYLAQLKARDARERIMEAFARADDKNILFVGEKILDVYHYVQGLGRASKEMMLATVTTGREYFDGGITASAKHGEWGDARVVTGARPIIKTRYVDADFNRKLFDVYSDRRLELDDEARHHFRDELQDACNWADVIVVNDFGHGLIGGIERGICAEKGFLAVNCQSNAGNYGYNLVTKYSAADYICIDEPEARLAAGMQTESLTQVVRHLGIKISCNKFLITHGRFGSMNFNTTSSSIASSPHPALAVGGVDTMGAGDAVMAVTAPLVAVGLDLALAAFVGNVVGAIKVGIVGHRRHVGRLEILQTIEALLA